MNTIKSLQRLESLKEKNSEANGIAIQNTDKPQSKEMLNKDRNQNLKTKTLNSSMSRKSAKKAVPKKELTKGESGKQEGQNHTVLVDWIIKPMPDSRGVCVEGQKQGMEDFWHSTAIIEAKRPNLVVTVSGSLYKLKGKLNKLCTVDNGFSKDVANAFVKGFPKNWKEIIHNFYRDLEDSISIHAEYTPVKGKKLPKLMSNKMKKASKEEDSPLNANSTWTPAGLIKQNITTEEVTVTRSGRMSLPPLAGWVGQRYTAVPGTNRIQVICETDCAEKALSREMKQVLQLPKRFQMMVNQSRLSKSFLVTSDCIEKSSTSYSKNKNVSPSCQEKPESCNLFKTSPMNPPRVIQNTGKNLNLKQKTEGGYTQIDKSLLLGKELRIVLEDTLKLPDGLNYESDSYTDKRVVARDRSRKDKLTEVSSAKINQVERDCPTDTKICMPLQLGHEACEAVGKILTRRKNSHTNVFASRKSNENVNDEDFRMIGSSLKPVTRKSSLSSSSRSLNCVDQGVDSDEQNVRESLQTSLCDLTVSGSNSSKIKTRKSIENRNKGVTGKMLDANKTQADETSGEKKSGENLLVSPECLQKSRKRQRQLSYTDNLLHKKTKVDEDNTWTLEEKNLLQRALKEVNGAETFYWQKISKIVETRSEEECQQFYREFLAEKVDKKTKKSSRKAVTHKKTNRRQKGDPIQGGKGTLKRKQDLRDFLDEQNEGYQDNCFESTPFLRRKSDLTGLPFGLDKNDTNSFWANLDCLTPGISGSLMVTPSGRIRPHLASVKKTPYCGNNTIITTPLPVNRRDIDKYIKTFAERKRKQAPVKAIHENEADESVLPTKSVFSPVISPNIVVDGPILNGDRNDTDADDDDSPIMYYWNDEY